MSKFILWNRLNQWRHDPATEKSRIEWAFALMFVTGFVLGIVTVVIFWVFS